jgi:hypothetical protein
VIRRPGRVATCLVAVAFVSLLPVAGAAAAPTPEERLVSAYAPITMLRAQEDPPCDTAEEQFSPPTTVDVVLGNPEVTLTHNVGDRDVPVKRAPTAADIAGLGEDHYLDLPGDPLSPGGGAGLGDNTPCPYAEDFARLKAEGKTPAATYAHIAREPGDPGLVVQYWFFYYFNQFNDIHEGDWEGMQIAFEEEMPEAALAAEPSEIALFQHAGGERADWDDTKVQKEGMHPVVFPAAGSHATFYDDAIYIENGQNGSGVGCDNTSEPLQRVEPMPVVVPTDPARGSHSQWLTFLGHWGERESGFNNGPQGPITKRQWREPFTWMEDIRQTSPRLPGGTVLGPAASTAFCGAIATVSEFINLKAQTTVGAFGLAAALLVLILLPVVLTRWRPVDLSTLRHRWAFGQLLRGARQLYGRHWRTLVPIALTGFVLLAAIQGLEYLIAELAGGHDFTLRITPGDLEFTFSGSLGGIAEPIGFAFVSGAVVAFLRLREDGEPAGWIDSYRAMYERLWQVFFGQLAATALVVLMIFTVIGIPFGIYFYVAWQFVQQEILFENRSVRDAFRGSHALVRGNWWRTLRVAGFLWLLSVIAGPILGFFLIFLNLSPVMVNLIGSVVFALLIPYVAIGRTLLYFDLGAREAEPAEKPRRRWRLRSRPAEAG